MDKHDIVDDIIVRFKLQEMGFTQAQETIIHLALTSAVTEGYVQASLSDMNYNKVEKKKLYPVVDDDTQSPIVEIINHELDVLSSEPLE